MSLASTTTCPHTGSWSQQWSCGLHEPVSPTITNAGFTTGHTAAPMLIVAVIILFIIMAVTKGKRAVTSK